METGRYADALFFIHLSLEAELKRVVVEKSGEQAPRIHDLPRLAYLAGLEPDEAQRQQLETITTFNMRARYDDYKLSLYKKATKEYTQALLQQASRLRLWIQNKQK
jgi:HEPN domain-containing protein